MEANAAVTFDSIASAITIDIVNDYTVAFIGTANGHLLKVCNPGKNISTFNGSEVWIENSVRRIMFLA